MLSCMGSVVDCGHMWAHSLLSEGKMLKLKLDKVRAKSPQDPWGSRGPRVLWVYRVHGVKSVGVEDFNKFNHLLPIPTGHGLNQPIYSYHVTQAGRNRVKKIYYLQYYNTFAGVKPLYSFWRQEVQLTIGDTQQWLNNEASWLVTWSLGVIHLVLCIPFGEYFEIILAKDYLRFFNFQQVVWNFVAQRVIGGCCWPC